MIICADSMVYANGPGTQPNNSPSLSEIGRQTHQLRGFMGSLHASLHRTRFAEIALWATDAVESNTLPIYGGDMWGGWFTANNSSRPISKFVGSDNVTSVGVNLVYVTDTLSPRNWAQHMAWGMCFPTNGPLVFIRVNDKGPGQFVTFEGTQPRTVEIEGTAISEVYPMNTFLLRQDGKYHHNVLEVTPEQNGRYAHFKTTVQVTKSTWFCVIAIGDREANISAMSGAVTVMLDRQLPVVRSGEQYAVCTVDQAAGEVQSVASFLGDDYSKAIGFYNSLKSTPPTNDPAPGAVTGLHAKVSTRTQADYLRVPEVVPAPAQLTPVWN
jgi:hypothetical protein